jgi:hypothetical protein
MRTRDKLAAALREMAAKGTDNAAKYEAFAARAETGEFDDYADPSDPAHICPITQLHAELTAAGLHKFAGRVAAGEFDATLEESEEWARSVTDPETKRMMAALGIGPTEGGGK